jgi:prophage antirepressor-like protein
MSLKNENQLKLFCTICNKMYASQSSLCNHRKKFHNNKEGNDINIKCSNKSINQFNNQSNNQSNNQFNNQSNNQSINQFNNQFNNQSNNQSNIIIEKTYKCNNCNKIYKHAQSKHKHQKTCKFKNNNIIENNTNNNELVELKNTISELKKLILQQTKITSKIQLKNNNIIVDSLNNTNKIINSNDNSTNSNNNEFINFTQNLITFNDKHIKFCYYNDQVYFKAKHITKILEYDDIAAAIINNIDIEDKFKIDENLGEVFEIITLPFSFIDTIKNEDFKTIFINESGLYSLISASKNTEANKFKKMITSKVLPYIRKYGSYSIINNYVEVDLDKYYGIDCVYVIHIKNNIYKYGNTSHLFKRLQSHKTNFNYKKIIKIYEMKNINDAKKLEKKIMNLTKSLNINIIYNLGNTNHKEMFEINNKDLYNIIKKIDDFTLDFNNKQILDNNIDLLKIENDNLKLKLELLKLSK